MMAKYPLAGILAGAVVIADQITKFLVDHWMSLYHSIPIVPDFFHLTYVRNTGAAFGFGAGSRSSLRISFFVLVSIVAIGCIFYLLKNLRSEQTSLTVSLSLVLGGAIGNLIDRLRLGEVIDFIDLHWYDIHWPAFNIADSAITVGVGLLLITMLRRRSLNF